MQVETFLPCFPGFYETNFEFNNEDMELENINDERAEIGLPAIGYDDVKWSYTDYRQNVSKKAVAYIEEILNDLLPCKLTFKKLQQPREYNFKTDMVIIDAEFDQEKLRRLLFECPIEAFEAMLENFKPSSGFAPFSKTLEKASLEYWQKTGFENLHDAGWAMQTILESHPDSEFDMDDFAFISTHEVEVGIDNYNELTTVPKTYKQEREKYGDMLYEFENVKLRHCFNPVSGTFFGVEICGFRDALFSFFQEYQEQIEEMIHPDDFFKAIGAKRI